MAPSPCSFLLSNDKISEMVGLIKVGDITCCCLDGYNCDVYKYLKNDYLTVSVYQIIHDVYQLIGRPIDNIDRLIKNCDQKYGMYMPMVGQQLSTRQIVIMINKYLRNISPKILQRCLHMLRLFVLDLHHYLILL